MDPASLHGLIGHALTHSDAVHQHHHAAMNDHEVLDVLRALQSMEPDALHALVLEILKSEVRTGNGTGLDSSASCSPQQSLLGALFGAKGCGKGYGTGRAPTPNPLAHLLGPLLAGKGFGKGAGGASGCDAQPPNPMQSLAPLLGAFLGGFGPTGMGSFPAASTSSDTPCNAEPNDDAVRRPAFEESVTDLVNMGLVTDRQVARELLTQHGDISTVVAILTESQE
jgi:hypothetical protein